MTKLETMTVRMNTKIFGGRNGQDWPDVGELIDLPESEARGMLLSGSVTYPNGTLGIPVEHDDSAVFHMNGRGEVVPFGGGF